MDCYSRTDLFLIIYTPPTNTASIGTFLVIFLPLPNTALSSQTSISPLSKPGNLLPANQSPEHELDTWGSVECLVPNHFSWEPLNLLWRCRQVGGESRWTGGWGPDNRSLEVFLVRTTLVSCVLERTPGSCLHQPQYLTGGRRWKSNLWSADRLSYRASVNKGFLKIDFFNIWNYQGNQSVSNLLSYL